MFDSSNPADLAALKAEFENDPLGLGYAATNGSTKDILSLFNTKNYTANKPIEDLTIPEVASVIDSAEYASKTEYEKEFVRMFIHQDADTLLSPFRDKMVNIFPPGSTTLTAIQGLRSVDVSRAEVLFGVGTEISRNDWFAARDS